MQECDKFVKIEEEQKLNNLIIYGTGRIYTEIKKFLKWEQINLIAFLETNVRSKFFEGKPVCTPHELGG